MKLKLLAGVLGLALVASNALWAGRYLELQSQRDDLKGRHQEVSRSLAQALAVANTLASNPAVSQPQLIKATKIASRDFDAFLIDGTFWVGSIGLHFNSAGRLIHAVTDWPIVREEFNSADTGYVQTGWVSCKEIKST